MKHLFNSISKSEWYFLLIISLVLIVVTGLPYLVGFLSAPVDSFYNGLGSLTPGDNPIYYSYIYQIKTGSFLISDLFTGENQSSAMLNIAWLGVGLFARIFKLSPIWAFHLVRLLLIPFFVLTLYLFLSLFFSEKNKRQLALILALFSAGLGAYLIAPLSVFDFSNQPGFWTPNDIWIPESITFLTIYKSPHFVASLTLLIAIYLLLFLAFRERKIVYSIGGGVLALIYFNFHPFYIPLVFSTLGLYLIFLMIKQKRILGRALGGYLLFIILSLPSIAYHFWVLWQQPLIAERAWQNVTLAPPFIFLLIGYGFLWLGAGLGVYFFVSRRDFRPEMIFIVTALAVALILVLWPSQFQSRYTQGLHLPLVILTVSGLYQFKSWLGQKNKKWDDKFWSSQKTILFLIFFLAFSFSTFFNWFRDVYYFTVKPVAVQPLFYLKKDLVVGFKSLEKKPAGVVLVNNIDHGLFLPGFSGQKVYVAHGIETIDYDNKLATWFWFFKDDKAASEKCQFLVEAKIDYLFFDHLGLNGFKPETKTCLNLIYQNPEALVYQVIK